MDEKIDFSFVRNGSNDVENDFIREIRWKRRKPNPTFYLFSRSCVWRDNNWMWISLMNLKAHATPEKLKLKWYETTQRMSSDLCGIVIVASTMLPSPSQRTQQDSHETKRLRLFILRSVVMLGVVWQSRKTRNRLFAVHFEMVETCTSFVR